MLPHLLPPHLLLLPPRVRLCSLVMRHQGTTASGRRRCQSPRRSQTQGTSRMETCSTFLSCPTSSTLAQSRKCSLSQAQCVSKYGKQHSLQPLTAALCCRAQAAARRPTLRPNAPRGVGWRGAVGGRLVRVLRLARLCGWRGCAQTWHAGALTSIARPCSRWDDGDLLNTDLVLFAATQSIHWRKSLSASVPLLVRLGTKNLGKTLHTPTASKVLAPSHEALPAGIYGAVGNPESLSNERLRSSLGGACGLLSTDLEDGKENSSKCTFPRAFDLYGLMGADDTLRKLFVCVGICTPYNLNKLGRDLKEVVMCSKALALGIEVLPRALMNSDDL